MCVWGGWVGGSAPGCDDCSPRTYMYNRRPRLGTELLGDGMDRFWAFPRASIPSWAELTSDLDDCASSVQVHTAISSSFTSFSACDIKKKCYGVYSGAHFRRSPVIDRLKSPKTDSSNPPQDLSPIKKQFWWSRFPLFL